MWVMEQKLHVDLRYYLTNHLQNPVGRIFAGIMPNPKELWTGPHMRHAIIPTGTTGLEAGLKRLPRCLCCRAAVAPAVAPLQPPALCDACRANELNWTAHLEAATDETAAAVALGDKMLAQVELFFFPRVFTLTPTLQCRACTGTQEGHRTCGARNCEIFYARTQSWLGADRKKGELERFRAQAANLEW